MTDYERYRNLAEKLSYKFNGIELSHVVACQIWGSANGEPWFRWRHFCRIIMANDVKSMYQPSENGFVATCMEAYRKDHYGLFNSIVNRLSICPRVNILFKMEKRLSFHPKIIGIIFSDIMSQLKNTELSFWQKIEWVVEYIFLCNTIIELDKIDFSKVNKYLCQCHVLGFENLLTQYFRNKGIETFSLQEGIYFVYKKNIVLGSIAYELFETDHLLCWGQYTKDEYKEYGIDPTRLSVAGYPKYAHTKPLKAGNEFKNLLVILAGPIFGDVNLRLLKMFNKLKNEFDVILKSHPSNFSEVELYAHKHGLTIVPKTQTIGDCIESGLYDFTIAVNTTAYYESWIAGVPSIRYYDERFDVFYGFDDTFSNEDEFFSLITKYKKALPSQEEVNQMLEYAIGVGIDNYDEIININ